MITMDRSIGNQWLVTDGLKEGDLVIVEGLMRVRPGMPVKALPEAELGAVGAAAPAKN
jgi:membrane fusion protein (multidrug efflux system)